MNAKKIVTAGLALVMVAGISVAGTLAYLTSTTDEVKNTFTVGSVAITLDEAPVDANGKKTTGDRVTANTYKLMPGHEYDKDPTVHFKAGSEASYLFVKVENGIAGAESTEEGYKNIAVQITENDWAALNGVTGVYYMKVNANTGDEDIDYPVFEGFTVSGALESDDLATYNGKTVTVTAYAIQADGFETADAAWTAFAGQELSE